MNGINDQRDQGGLSFDHNKTARQEVESRVTFLAQHIPQHLVECLHPTILRPRRGLELMGVARSFSLTTSEKNEGNDLKTILQLRAPVCRFILRRPPPLALIRVIYLLAENYGDPSGGMWSMYLAKAEKQDDQITRNWFEDTGGVLVFVSSKKSHIYSMPNPTRRRTVFSRPLSRISSR